MKKIAAAVSVLLAMAVMCGCSKSKVEGGKCPYCKKMEVKLPDDVQGAKITYKDGAVEYYCTMAHALMTWKLVTGADADPENPPVVEFVVVEYNSKELIDARQAFYVVGSSVKPVMFFQSVIAFEEMAAADKFVVNHGGTAMFFDELTQRDLTAAAGE